MAEEVKKDKDYIIAKMNHKVAIVTALIGLFATLSAVLIPLYNSKAEPTTQVQTAPTTTSSTTPSPTMSTTDSPTPTPTEEKKGKGKGD